jgi:hypothetical protein
VLQQNNEFRKQNRFPSSYFTSQIIRVYIRPISPEMSRRSIYEMSALHDQKQTYAERQGLIGAGSEGAAESDGRRSFSTGSSLGLQSLYAEREHREGPQKSLDSSSTRDAQAPSDLAKLVAEEVAKQINESKNAPSIAQQQNQQPPPQLLGATNPTRHYMASVRALISDDPWKVVFGLGFAANFAMWMALQYLIWKVDEHKTDKHHYDVMTWSVTWLLILILPVAIIGGLGWVGMNHADTVSSQFSKHLIDRLELMRV